MRYLLRRREILTAAVMAAVAAGCGEAIPIGAPGITCDDPIEKIVNGPRWSLLPMADTPRSGCIKESIR